MLGCCVKKAGAGRNQIICLIKFVIFEVLIAVTIKIVLGRDAV